MATRYFYATDGNWSNTNNWYSDQAHTSNTNVLPISTDDVILLSNCSSIPTNTTVNSLCCLNNTILSENTLTVSTSAVFIGNSRITRSAIINGTAYFFDQSGIISYGYIYNYGSGSFPGIINGTSYFYNSSFNGGNVINAYFYNNSYNYYYPSDGGNGAVHTNLITNSAFFYNNSYNGENCNVPHGVFYDNSDNYGIVDNYFFKTTNYNLLSSIKNVNISLIIDNNLITNKTFTLTGNLSFSPVYLTNSVLLKTSSGLISSIIFKDTSSLGSYCNAMSSINISFNDNSYNNTSITNASSNPVIFNDTSYTLSPIYYATLNNNLSSFLTNGISYNGLNLNYINSNNITLTGNNFLNFKITEFIKNTYFQNITGIILKDTSNIQYSNLKNLNNLTLYFYDSAYCQSSSISLNSYYYDNSYSDNGFHNKNSNFYNNSYNNSYQKLAHFYNNSKNNYICSNAVFYNNAVNTGTIEVSAIFNDNSSSTGLYKNVIFNDYTFNSSGQTYTNAVFNNLNKGIFSTNILELASDKRILELPLPSETIFDFKDYFLSIRSLVAYYDARFIDTEIDLLSYQILQNRSLNGSDLTIYVINNVNYANNNNIASLKFNRFVNPYLYKDSSQYNPDVDVLNVPKITISMFFKIQNYPPKDMYLIRKPNDKYLNNSTSLREDQFSLKINYNNRSLDLSRSYNNGASYETLSYAPIGAGIQSNFIYHVVAVINTVTHSMKMYINGILCSQKTISNNPFDYSHYSDINFILGNNTYNGYYSKQFNGDIYNVAIFNDELPATTIQNIFNLNRTYYGI
jgi:hypothetical protein